MLSKDAHLTAQKRSQEKLATARPDSTSTSTHAQRSQRRATSAAAVAKQPQPRCMVHTPRSTTLTAHAPSTQIARTHASERPPFSHRVQHRVQHVAIVRQLVIRVCPKHKSAHPDP